MCTDRQTDRTTTVSLAAHARRGLKMSVGQAVHGNHVYACGQQYSDQLLLSYSNTELLMTADHNKNMRKKGEKTTERM